MKWVRGAMVGRGSFGTVNLATPLSLSKSCPQTPLIVAVKSAILSQSLSLKKEGEILAELQDCAHVIRCFGHDVTNEKGQRLYNLFLEYASGGNLADRGRLPESDVRGYTASILKGLRYIHQKGYVHCDIKLRNILVCSSSSDVKIADFGLTKKAGVEAEDGVCLRGTPLYMAPESVARSEYQPPSDIWSLGCAVVEMISGKPAWSCAASADVNALLFRIAFGDELPEIPWELSEEGRDFLRRCFVRDPMKRWTAEMLLHHPFVANGLMGGDESLSAVKSNPSPRSAFDFMTWDSLQSSSSFESFITSQGEFDTSQGKFDRIGISSPADRIRQLATEQRPNWSACEDDWITSRKEDSSVSQSDEAAEIQADGCSVSSRSESLLVLEEMMMTDGKREGSSDSSAVSGIGLPEFAASTSSTAVDNRKPLDVSHSNYNGSDLNPSFKRCRREVACRGNRICGNDDNIDSSFFSFPCKNRNCNCFDSSISNEFKHRRFQ